MLAKLPLIALLWLIACTESGRIDDALADVPGPSAPEAPQLAPILPYRVVNAFPHDTGAFTQGLLFLEGLLYEGTGLRGNSSLRKVDLASGAVLQQVDLDERLFGEGVTVFGDRVYQLTWQAGVALVYDKDTFEPLFNYEYETEGWGLTHDAESLIMSDGSSELYFRDPGTFAEIRRLQVTDGGRQITRLNELEYVEGHIYANVWQTDRVARIDPQTGNVTAWLDLSGLLSPQERRGGDVLNGIAYDPGSGHLLVTGKLWPKLFEIQMVTPEE
jgi:glutaminyl-peptide cyclotransferase